MASRKNDNACVCPHCGVENDRAAELWVNCISDKEAVLCVHCNKELYDNSTPGSLDREKVENRHFNIRFFTVAILLSGLMICLNRAFDVFSFKEDSGQIIYEILIVLVISSTLASGKLWQKLRYLTIWAVIFLVMITGYSYRHELSRVKERVVAELVPSKGFQNTPDSISFPVSSDGHFYIRAKVNGIPVMFLADTGASHIVLSPGDAGKLGIDVTRLDFDRYYETANGRVRGSSFRIDDFRIGGIHLEKIGASINEAEMRDSLLGMTFFRRLRSYEVKDEVLTLRWRR